MRIQSATQQNRTQQPVQLKSYTRGARVTHVRHQVFSIRLLPEDLRTDDGARIGEIRIDNFREQFACYPAIEGSSVDGIEFEWLRQLALLCAGHPAVALVHDPRFAWVFYRVGADCFIQQCFARDGNFESHIQARVTAASDGQVVSEWKCAIQDIHEGIDA